MTVELYKDIYYEIFLHIKSKRDQLAFALVCKDFHELFKTHCQPDVTDMIRCCFKGRLQNLKWMIEVKGLDPAAKNNEALREAVLFDKVAVVKYLVTLPGVDPTLDNNALIKHASSHGHFVLAQFLASLPGVDSWSFHQKYMTSYYEQNETEENEDGLRWVRNSRDKVTKHIDTYIVKKGKKK